MEGRLAEIRCYTDSVMNADYKTSVQEDRSAMTQRRSDEEEEWAADKKKLLLSIRKGKADTRIEKL